jgi:HEAT repeat protein
VVTRVRLAAAAAAALFAAAASATRADTVVLTFGPTIEGPLVARDFDRLGFETRFGRLLVPRRLIAARLEDGRRGAPRRADAGASAAAAAALAAPDFEAAAAALDDPGRAALLEAALGPEAPARPRAAILAALARAPGAAAEPLLAIALCSEADWARREAACLLGRTGRGPALDALLEAIHDPDPTIAALACEAAAAVARRTSDPDAAREALARDLGRRCGRHPLYARFLARLATPAAGQELVAIARSRDPVACLRALDALPLAGGVAGDTAAALAALDASDPALRAAAATALGRLRDLTAVPRLAPLLDPTAAPGLRRAARAALERLTGAAPGPDRAAWEPVLAATAERLAALDDLLALTAAPDAAIRTAAATALGRVRDRRSLAALLVLLRDPSPAPAAAACAALGALGFEEAVPPLVTRLADGPPEVRKAARDALVELTGKLLPPDAAAWKAWLRDH